MFPYMQSAGIVVCPSAPQAVDLCTDIPLAIQTFSSQLGGAISVGPGDVDVVGNVVYLSYVFNCGLFGVGDAVVNLGGTSIDIRQIYTAAKYLPSTLADIQYPADTPTFYDGYITGNGGTVIANPLHTQTANLAYADGHSKSFRMSMQQNCGNGNNNCVMDNMGTGKWTNQYYVDHGPYRAHNGDVPSATFDGIVTDPVCPTTEDSRNCLTSHW
jgi:prepilin-type processing-associated H-X9-DG protein